MKKIIILIIIALISINCKSQIIAVENFESYNQELEDGAHIKDINNVLNKYEGTWEGTYDDKNFEFVVQKVTQNNIDLNYKHDLLVMRYKITDSNGNIIESNLTPNIDVPEIEGKYLSNTGTYYVMSYDGRDFVCGQSGDIFIETINNNTQMKLYLVPRSDLMSTKDCPNGEAAQIMPVEGNLILTKQ